MRTAGILALLLLSLHSKAQFAFERITERDGLSSGTIYNIIEDSRGYMWFATVNGLNRYDGEVVKVFAPTPEGRPDMTVSNVRDILEDSKGNIWVSDRSGQLNQYITPKDTFINHTVERAPWKKTSPVIWDIYEDPDERIYLSTKAGIYFSSHPFSDWRLLGDTTLYNSVHPFSMIADRMDPHVMWVGCRTDDLVRFDTRTGAYQRFSVPKGQKSFDLFYHEDGAIYSKTDGGFLMRFNIQDEHFDLFPIPGELGGNALQIEWRSATELWIATQHVGLIIFNTEKEEFRALDHSDLTRGINAQRLYSLYGDDQGSLWIGTYSNGIFKMQPDPYFFQYGFIKPEEALKYLDIEKPNVRDVHLSEFSDDLVVFATGNSAYQVDKSGHITESWPPALEKEDGFFRFYESNGGLLLTSQRGFWWVDRKRKKIVPSRVNEQLTNFELLTQKTVVGPEGNFWNVSSNPPGVLNLLVQEDKLIFYPCFDSKGTDFNTNAAFRSHRLVWPFSTGLMSFDIYERTFKRTGYPDDLKSELPLRIIEMSINSDGIIWMTNENRGLVRIDWNDDKIEGRAVTVSDGLPTNRASRMAIDDHGRTWLASRAGICVLDDKRDHIRILKEREGLLEDHLGVQGRVMMHRKENGRIFLNGRGYYTLFDPAQLPLNDRAPKPRIDGVRIANTIVKENTSFLESLDLQPSQNFFSVFFSCDNLINADDNSYEYRLLGLSEDWTSSMGNTASYTNLDPGRYTFQLKAFNNDGVESEQLMELSIRVLPFFWQTWWFRLLIALLVLGILYSLYLARVALIKKEEATKRSLEKKISDMELVALRSQMNPHFIFNSLNSIKSYIARNKPRIAADYLSKFAQLMRNILSNSEQSSISVARELEATRLYIDLEQMRFDERFSYTIDVSPKVEVHTTAIQPLILQPYVENAIWHGLMPKKGKGKLDIRVSTSYGVLYIEIEDNGVGRAAARELKSGDVRKGKSYGMTIASDMLKHFALDSEVEVVDLVDKAQQPSGTLVRLILPVRQLTAETEDD